TLPRRIEHYLWDGPKSVDELAPSLPSWEPEEIEAALTELVEQGRARPVPDTAAYAVVSKQANLLEGALSARIDALNNLVDALGDLVESRFLDEDPRGMARTITLRIPKTALPSIKEELFALVYKHCELLDAVATPDDDGYYLIYALTPMGAKRRREDDE
ncbi:MAG: hypothetical protein KC609_26915, partial [Myxococcales bacterium]|nr:hypothetical protein [Myxococcales bacterium]